MRLSSFDKILIEEAYLDINNDYFKKLEIGVLCEKYELSEIKLIKGFKEIYGVDIRDYYTEICMEFAKEEYENGATLKDLSIVFQYGSVQKFSRDFKEYLRQQH